MKIERLPSGTYRVRKTYNKKTYSATFDHKPTQREVSEALQGIIKKSSVNVADMTFKEACESYIESKSNVLSASTLKGYRDMILQFSEGFLEMKLRDISAIDVQREVNSYASNHSPKSVLNFHGFISPVLKTFNPDLVLRTKLPQKKKVSCYHPTDEDITKINEYFKDTPYEIAIYLAEFGLRRSEICALTLDDLNGNILTINKALVKGVNSWTLKDTTKTMASTRSIQIPDELADRIREKGFIFEYKPEALTNALTKAQKKLGIEHFNLHMLRHYFASKLHALGVSDASILEIGGWESDFIMKKVYRYALDQKHSNALDDLWNDIKE